MRHQPPPDDCEVVPGRSDHSSNDYSPPTGQIIRAVDIGVMRRALDQAMSLLNGSHLVTTNPSGFVLANDFNQLREGVR
jgi:hypothetical protein